MVQVASLSIGNDQKMTNVGKSNGSGGEDMTQNRWNWYPPGKAWYPPRKAKGRRKVPWVHTTMLSSHGCNSHQDHNQGCGVWKCAFIKKRGWNPWQRCYWCLSLMMIGCLKPTKGVRKAHQTIPGLALIVSVGFPDKLQGITKKPQEAYFVNIDQCRAVSYSKLYLP